MIIGTMGIPNPHAGQEELMHGRGRGKLEIDPLKNKSKIFYIFIYI
jgi:hypothetical protein